MVQHSELQSLLKEFKSGLESVYGPRLKGLYLFGSYARHEQVEGSDIDTVVVLEKFEDSAEEVNKTGDLLWRLSLKYGVTVSEVFVKQTDWLHKKSPFLDNVREESIAA